MRTEMNNKLDVPLEPVPAEQKIEALSLYTIVKAILIGSFAGSVFALLSTTYLHLDERAASLAAKTPEPGAVHLPGAGTPAVAAGNTADHLDAYAWSVRVRLENLDILRPLAVSVTGDGKIAVTGNLMKTHEERYRAFKQWMQEQNGFPELVDQVNILEISPEFPRVRSVWLGTKPAVHFETGESASIGTVIANGWTILSISRDSITLERQGTVIEMDLLDG